MEFILFFLLRRRFVRIMPEADGYHVVKGLVIRRDIFIPLGSVTRIEIRRTPLLRLFGGKRVEISTYCGGAWFYLGRREAVPFLPEYEGAAVKAGVFRSIAGAFIDTRALSGTAVFAITLNRIGGIFGGKYYDRILSAMSGAADGITNTLADMKVAVPRVTAFAAVFVGAAWTLAFIRKALALSRFRLSCERGYITVRRGVITIYEIRLVRNNLVYCARCDTLTTLALKSAPLYCGEDMLFPPTDKKTGERLISKLCGVPLPDGERIVPPGRALFGHCSVPLGWLFAVAGLMVISYHREHLWLMPLLWSGAAVCVWFAVTYGIYMTRSGASDGKYSFGISFRRGARLYSAVLLKRRIVFRTIGRNIFQVFSGMCDAAMTAMGGDRFKLRNVLFPEILRILKS